ncbi:hypothetical protein ABK040_012673 [Willaertia magna]
MSLSSPTTSSNNTSSPTMAMMMSNTSVFNNNNPMMDPIIEPIHLKIIYDNLDNHIIRNIYSYPSDTSISTLKLKFLKQLNNKELTNENTILLIDENEILNEKKTLQENKCLNPYMIYHCKLITIDNNNNYINRECIKVKKRTVEIKLKIQEKIGDQLLTCDIVCKSNKKFGVIATMYCKHRNYQPIEDYLFANEKNVLLKFDKSLNAMGFNDIDKIYIINVYHKDMVSLN